MYPNYILVVQLLFVKENVAAVTLDRKMLVQYNVPCMEQIVNISKARRNLADLVKGVAKTGKRVIIVRQSFPEVAIVPYQEILEREKEKDKLWDLRFEKVLKESRQLFKKFLKGRRISKITEDQTYELLKKV